jgi:asparagine synthase (glutamine-hydrolysing)
MCGIAGIIALTPEFKQKAGVLLDQMLNEIQHRGPDQRGTAQYDNMFVGMNRLSIIDTDEHVIPYSDEADKLHIVYNGEIYNHDEIRSGLRSSFYFKSASDAETALYNYALKGDSSFSDYNGMYAFAIVDEAQRKVKIVRDKSGEKPLYYIKTEQFFAFASEIKAFGALISFEYNPVVSYRAYEFCVGSETLFKDVFQLEPGEFLEVDYQGEAKIKPYWKVWDNLVDLPDDETRLVDQLTELVEDSIRLRTKNCAHKFAIFTGGGVDSALMACIAKPERLYYCHYDEGKAFDELEYAQLVAKKIDTELILVCPDKEDFQRTRTKIAHHLDTPCTWTSFSLWMLLEHLHDDIKVVMTGEGADEMFAGYHRYHLLHHDQQIHALEAMQSYDYLINKYYGSSAERYRKLVNRCDNIYDHEVQDYLLKSIEFYFSRVEDDVVHGMGLNDFYTTMQVLLQMSDRLNMAFSVENRSPFLDYRLMQFAFSLPSKYKIRNGITKWILKEVSKKFIPLEIANRIDKRGFSAPVNKWFGWDKKGKYNRSIYRELVFEDWSNMFGIKKGLAE